MCQYMQELVERLLMKMVGIYGNLLVKLSFLTLFKTIFASLKGKANFHQKKENIVIQNY